MIGIASWRFRIVWQRQAELGDGSVVSLINHRLGLWPRRCHPANVETLEAEKS